MLSSNAAEEVSKQEKIGRYTSDLRERMDLDYGLFTLEDSLYFIPVSEGKWDNVKTNRASSEGHKMIDYLSYARRMLWIPHTDETETGRKRLEATERLGVGCLYLADQLNQDLPFYIDIQSLLAFYRILRGMSAGRYILREDEDKLIPDIAIWDARNTYWMEGKKRLTWACYVRYASEDEVKDEYKGWNGKAAETNDTSNMAGYVKIHDLWGFPEEGKLKDICHEGVIINSDWVKEPESTGLDYLPVRINAGRSTPLIMDGTLSNTTKNVAESYLVNNRDMLPIESRLLTYKVHRAGQEAKAPRPVMYDGAKSNNEPPAWDDKVYSKGSFIPVDTSKGEEIGEPLIPKSEGHIDSSLAVWMGLENTGGLPPIAHGAGPTPDTAQGTDIVFKAAMDALMPFKLGMEKDIIWYAEESVRQFKNGDFDQHEIEGYDKGNNRFKVKVRPEEIDESWHFKCVLIPDELREKAIKMGIADQAVKGGFMSVESASDQFQIVENPTLEQEKIDRERAKQIMPELAMFEMSEAKLEDLGIVKSDDKKRQKAKAIIENMIIRMKISQMLQQTMGQGMGEGMGQGGGQNVEGIPRPMPPSAETAGMASAAGNTARMPQPVVPGPVRDAARGQGV